MATLDPGVLARLRLALIPGLGPITQLCLVRRFGCASAIFSELDAVGQFAGPAAAAALAAGPDPGLVDRTLAWLDLPDHHLVTYEDPLYPSLLREIPDPPGVLYVLGNVDRLQRTCMAIVGARNATPSGARDAHDLASALSARGICIASGLALGIDAAAHKGGLQGSGSSIAVMGTGPDRFYPARNRDLAARLVAEGCVVTEFPLGTPPLPGNFPRRNRLISGLARAVLVVEANEHSGSLVTARCALGQDRDVLAMPGSIHSPLSKGCHRLIKEGAALVECANDVLAAIGAPCDEAQAPRTRAQRSDSFLEALGDAPTTLDRIATLTGLSPSVIAGRLSVLQIEGTVEELPGGRFQRVDRPA